MHSLTLYDVTDNLAPEFLKYSNALKIAGEAFKELDELFNSHEFENKIDWKKEGDDEGAICHSKKTERGRMIALQTELECDLEGVIEETKEGLDALPAWNPNVAFAEMIVSPTENFDICNYANNDLFIITGRDVVCTRLFRKTNNGYIVASRSVELAERPERKDKVRAEIILGGARFREHPSNSRHTIVEAIMLADPKGMLPKALVNQVLGKITLLDSKNNREHFAKIGKIRNQKKG